MIPAVAASEPGGAQTGAAHSVRALPPRGRGARLPGLHPRRGVTKRAPSGTALKGRRNRVMAPYAKGGAPPAGGPKYGGARGTLPESAATMRQG